ncbi:MAG: peptidyl-prolyl cis-trans isomerase [Deltaproteobacteria bacterium]|nr:peptidyl-prolyl cis-trans isomerase [Deltaproteobacteria bacterium]
MPLRALPVFTLALVCAACPQTSKTNPTAKPAAKTAAATAGEKAAPAATPVKPAAKSTTPTKPAKKVEIKTSLGVMVVEIDTEKAPISALNFTQYVKDGHYDGTIFHRVISTFMIQGGGFSTNRQKKPTRAGIQNEADNGLKNLRGTLAMARTRSPHSAQAQFFINVVDNAFLDHKGKTSRGWGYTVFGKVVKGMDVVNKIKAVAVSNEGGPFANMPTTPVVIEKVRVLE